MRDPLILAPLSNMSFRACWMRCCQWILSIRAFHARRFMSRLIPILIKSFFLTTQRGHGWVLRNLMPDSRTLIKLSLSHLKSVQYLLFRIVSRVREKAQIDPTDDSIHTSYQDSMMVGFHKLLIEEQSPNHLEKFAFTVCVDAL